MKTPSIQFSVRSTVVIVAATMLFVACRAPAPTGQRPDSGAEPSPEPEPGPKPEPSPEPLFTIPNDAPTNESSCEDRQKFASEAISSLTDAANGACSTPEDCAIAFADTQCAGGCQVPILASQREPFERAQAAINERACIDYASGGCPYATPGCVAVEARCQAGRCELVPSISPGNP